METRKNRSRGVKRNPITTLPRPSLRFTPDTGKTALLIFFFKVVISKRAKEGRKNRNSQKVRIQLSFQYQFTELRLDVYPLNEKLSKLRGTGLILSLICVNKHYSLNKNNNFDIPITHNSLRLLASEFNNSAQRYRRCVKCNVTSLNSGAQTCGL